MGDNARGPRTPTRLDWDEQMTKLQDFAAQQERKRRRDEVKSGEPKTKRHKKKHGDDRKHKSKRSKTPKNRMKHHKHKTRGKGGSLPSPDSILLDRRDFFDDSNSSPGGYPSSSSKTVDRFGRAKLSDVSDSAKPGRLQELPRTRLTIKGSPPKASDDIPGKRSKK